MSSPRLGFRHALLVLASITLCAAPPAKPAVRVGFAERDITPDIGMEVPGNYGKVYSKKIHDACKVRASVFDDGRKRVALVGIDALMIRRETVQVIRAQVKAAVGIDDVMIGASHSHSSGPIGMILPGEFDHASAEIQELAYQKSSCADAGYLKKVVAATVEAIEPRMLVGWKPALWMALGITKHRRHSVSMPATMPDNAARPSR